MTTTSAEAQKRVLVIGASRGLGLAIVEQYLELGWNAVGTVRGSERTKLHALREQWGDRLAIEPVDITVPADIDGLRSRLAGQPLDLLLVNAGVKNDDRETIADVSTAEFVRVMVTNALSPLRAIETLESLVPSDGTIAIMSSGQGSVANNERGGYEVYRASKAALNTLMRSFAARHAGEHRTALALGARLGPHRHGRPERRAPYRGEHSESRPHDRSAARETRPAVPRLSRSYRALVAG